MEQVGAEISRRIWKAKYRYQQEGIIAQSWHRIARALAMVETKDRVAWEERFFSILQDFKFLPGGRIQAGAGTERNVTLFIGS
jgi:ribonucleoside-diphosphate reductase alpha chain